jgi:uncharacterized protein YdcH (DUF465 family)
LKQGAKRRLKAADMKFMAHMAQYNLLDHKINEGTLEK